MRMAHSPTRFKKIVYPFIPPTTDDNSWQRLFPYYSIKHLIEQLTLFSKIKI